MNDFSLIAQKREISGKKVRRLRSAGQLPAVAYGHDSKSEALTLDAKTTERVYAHAGSSKLVELKVEGGKMRNVIFHDVQLSPRTGAIIHADLYIVRMDELLKAEVPLHYHGESTAVYQDEGTLVKNLDTVEIECLPGDLPEAIEVDISVLDDFDKTIMVSALKIPKGVTLLTEDPDTTLVAKVDPPRSEEEMAELDATIDEASEIPENAKEEAPSVVLEENEGDADRRDKK